MKATNEPTKGLEYFLWLSLGASAALMGVRSPISAIPVGGGIPLILVILGLSCSVTLLVKKKADSFKFNSYCGALFLAAILFLFSTLYANDAAAGLDSVVKLLAGIVLIAYISSLTASIDRFLFIWAATSTVIMLIYIVNSYLFLDSGYMVNDLALRTRSGKNQIAFYLAAFIATVLVYKFTAAKQGNSVLWIVFITVHFVALVYVMSRAAWVSVGFFLTVALFYRILMGHKFKDLLFVVIGIIALSVAVIYVGVSEELAARVSSLITLEDESGGGSIQSRENLASQAYYTFSDNPILGVGVGGFFEKYQKASHNTYLQYVSEMGVLGILVIILVHLFPLGYFLYKSTVCRTSAMIAIGIASIIIYGLAINIQNSPIWFLSMAVFFRIHLEVSRRLYE